MDGMSAYALRFLSEIRVNGYDWLRLKAFEPTNYDIGIISYPFTSMEINDLVWAKIKGFPFWPG
jgi:hypothetical protein